MDPHQLQQLRIDSLESQNSELKIKLSQCRQLVTHMTQFALMKATVLGPGADNPHPELQSEALRQQLNQRTAELQATVHVLETQIMERDQIEKKLLQSKKKLQRLSRHTLEMLENNSRKIARELHDSIGNNLSAIKLIVEENQAHIQNGAGGGQLTLQPIIHYLILTIKQIKSISARLRPTILDDLGLHATLSAYFREFAAIREDIRIEHRIDVSEEQIPEDYKIVLYRIIQEAMANAAQHARPTLIQGKIDRNDKYIRLEVRDDGCGFNPRQVLSAKDQLHKYGLQSMRGRAEICGGIFKIESGAGMGTRIRVWLPLRSGAAKES